MSAIGNRESYSHAILRDGTGDMVIEIIVIRKLFIAGEKIYATISRETESGFYCTYQGGPSSNIRDRQYINQIR